MSRCDGKTAHLYAEKFDFASRPGRFRPVDDTPRIPADAPELVASRSPPAGVPAGATPLDFRVLAASSSSSADGPDDLVAPAEIEDGNPATAWVEGRSGFGRGEFVTARASLDRGLVRAIRLVPGHGASPRTFAEFNRLKQVGLLVGRDRAFRVRFPRDPARSGAPGDPWWIALPEPVAADCVSLVVSEVYFGQGGRSGRTAISELAVLTEMDLAPGGAAPGLAAQVAAGGREGEQAARVLARLGTVGEAALVAEARKPGSAAAAVLRVRRALADIPAGAEELARGLAGAEDADAERFVRALAAIGAPAIEPLAAVSGEGGVLAARALGRIPDAAALRVLIAAAGRGSREVRRAVALAIGARSAGELDEVLAATAATDEPREADLWRAAGLMLRASEPAARARGAGMLAARLAGARGYELRYRLLEAAGGLDDAGVVEAVAAQLAVGESERGGQTLAAAQATALRRAAAGALGRSRSPAAIAALVRAAGDPDPGVREIAARALGERAGGEAALAQQLGADRWSRVRRAAAVALGSGCGRGAPDALRSAALRDADVEVRRASLSSLASCRAPGLVGFLLTVAGDRDAPVDVRTHAFRLIGDTRDRSAQPKLAELVRAELDRAMVDENAIGPAAAGTYALGALADAAGLPVILRAAETAALPEIQAAAATALGRRCLPAGMAALRELAANPQHQVSAPARAALRRCARAR